MFAGYWKHATDVRSDGEQGAGYGENDRAWVKKKMTNIVESRT